MHPRNYTDEELIARGLSDDLQPVAMELATRLQVALEYETELENDKSEAIDGADGESEAIDGADGEIRSLKFLIERLLIHEGNNLL